ncbi:hypothetical protein K490DRAFT_61467 [Saccharata proteae CBS 121410]|uniref:Uncharacterized protein n=1 Tax=Saccharata proteae CBS 121410 TaxID=1314787 RepID=A0A9P4M290_9PEZI|nr:hypothetical protein K490DRAFT_61467 [Saccharata proteae CBS 121410]
MNSNKMECNKCAAPMTVRRVNDEPSAEHAHKHIGKEAKKTKDAETPVLQSRAHSQANQLLPEFSKLSLSDNEAEDKSHDLDAAHDHGHEEEIERQKATPGPQNGAGSLGDRLFHEMRKIRLTVGTEDKSVATHVAEASAAFLAAIGEIKPATDVDDEPLRENGSARGGAGGGEEPRAESEAKDRPVPRVLVQCTSCEHNYTITKKLFDRMRKGKGKTEVISEGEKEVTSEEKKEVISEGKTEVISEKKKKKKKKPKKKTPAGVEHTEGAPEGSSNGPSTIDKNYRWAMIQFQSKTVNG